MAASSAALFAIFLFPLTFCLFARPSGAILCRTGVDQISGPVADCGNFNPCLNTTSPRASVYSCDHGGICESILNMRDGCVKDGQNMVCCCSSSDLCNFGLTAAARHLPLSVDKFDAPFASENEFGRIVLPFFAKSMGAAELCTI